MSQAPFAHRSAASRVRGRVRLATLLIAVVTSVSGIITEPARGLPPGGADDIQVVAIGSARRSCAAFFYRSTDTDFEVFGQFELTYGVPLRPDKSTADFERAKPGDRLPLGDGSFATFDTSCPVRIGDARLEPGLYDLVLQRAGGGELASLVFLDPTGIRAKKLTVVHSGETTGGVIVPLEWSEEETAEPLEIQFDPDRRAPAARLVIRQGRYEMETKLEAVIEKPGGPVQVGAARYERQGRAGYFFTGDADRHVDVGYFELTYGSPIWKPEYATIVRMAKAGDRFRIGNDFFATFDTTCPVEIGGMRLDPGHYYLALERGPGRTMSLCFLDPAPIRARRMNANDTANTEGGTLAPLVWADDRKVVADELEIMLDAGSAGSPSAAGLVMRFGPFEMKAEIRPIVSERSGRDGR